MPPARASEEPSSIVGARRGQHRKKSVRQATTELAREVRGLSCGRALRLDLPHNRRQRAVGSLREDAPGTARPCARVCPEFGPTKEDHHASGFENVCPGRCLGAGDWSRRGRDARLVPRTGRSISLADPAARPPRRFPNPAISLLPAALGLWAGVLGWWMGLPEQATLVGASRTRLRRSSLLRPRTQYQPGPRVVIDS